jgi:hypothetical protein
LSLLQKPGNQGPNIAQVKEALITLKLLIFSLLSVMIHPGKQARKTPLEAGFPGNPVRAYFP